MKIYTKKGDSGTTGLIGGTRLPKHHIRIEAYGTVDELNSYVGLLRDLTLNDKHVFSVLLEIQDRLFTLGSHLAADHEKSQMKLPELKASDIEFLEKEIDQIDAQVPPMKSFVLPGGHPTVSHCHLARCICRREELLVTELGEISPQNPVILSYLNRLSDYLFMLSRYLTVELRAQEIPWNPRVD